MPRMASALGYPRIRLPRVIWRVGASSMLFALFRDLTFLFVDQCLLTQITRGLGPNVVDRADGHALILCCEGLNLLVAKDRGQSHLAGMRRRRCLQALHRLLREFVSVQLLHTAGKYRV